MVIGHRHTFVSLAVCAVLVRSELEKTFDRLLILCGTIAGLARHCGERDPVREVVAKW